MSVVTETRHCLDIVNKPAVRFIRSPNTNHTTIQLPTPISARSPQINEDTGMYGKQNIERVDVTG